MNGVVIDHVTCFFFRFPQFNSGPIPLFSTHSTCSASMYICQVYHCSIYYIPSLFFPRDPEPSSCSPAIAPSAAFNCLKRKGRVAVLARLQLRRCNFCCSRFCCTGRIYTNVIDTYYRVCKRRERGSDMWDGVEAKEKLGMVDEVEVEGA